MNVFLVNWLDDCLMWLNISLIALKTWKILLSWSILINLQPSLCSIAFFCLYFLVSISVTLSIFITFFRKFYSHENINQFYNLKHIEFVCFLLQINLLFLSALFVLLLKWHHIFGIKSFCKFMCWCYSTIYIRILLDYFFCSSTSPYLCFFMFWMIFYCLAKFFDLILFLYFFI